RGACSASNRPMGHRRASSALRVPEGCLVARSLLRVESPYGTTPSKLGATGAGGVALWRGACSASNRPTGRRRASSALRVPEGCLVARSLLRVESPYGTTPGKLGATGAGGVPCGAELAPRRIAQ